MTTDDELQPMQRGSRKGCKNIRANVHQLAGDVLLWPEKTASWALGMSKTKIQMYVNVQDFMTTLQ